MANVTVYERNGIVDGSHEVVGNDEQNERTTLSSEDDLNSINLDQLTSPTIPSSLNLIPPRNFGKVFSKRIFRSGFPKKEDFAYLANLTLTTIVTLVPGPYSTEYEEFMKKEGIRHIMIPLSSNRDALRVKNEEVAKILRIILDKTNQPVLIHCNQGKHRTGCVIGALRRVQGWHLEDALRQYRRFAGIKCRKLDQEFIKEFDIELVGEYANALEYPHPASDDHEELLIPLPSIQLFPN
jgi:protein-tyrosine phosphatase